MVNSKPSVGGNQPVLENLLNLFKTHWFLESKLLTPRYILSNSIYSVYILSNNFNSNIRKV